MNNASPVAILLASCLASLPLGAQIPSPANPPATNFTSVAASSAADRSSPSDPAWLAELPPAQARAKAEGKQVLLFFHGSDWCPTCAEMKHQVFDSAVFTEYARRSLVLVDVDFPEKQKQSEELRRANLALLARFNITRESGFPTIVLLNDAGETVFQETGYNGGGPAEILPSLRRHAGPGASAGNSAAFKNLSVDEFALMAADSRNTVLDVRTAKEFEEGHLPGAINLDVTAADFEARAASLDHDKIYLVHCASGVRSARACEKLVRLNFLKLYNLPGGFRAWAKAGKPVEK
jgi:rhodanese-related sulfurtransferase/thioredoxin-related protein